MEDECLFTYQEFPQRFVWLNSEKRWKLRQHGYAIGRMYFASPNCGERFYLRLLLTVVKGPKSFQCLRTVNNVLHDTFKSACVARGLLEDDEEWIQCLKEAAVMKTGYQLRRLFTIILTQCSPLQPYNEAQQADVEIIIDRLNNDQRTAYDAITSSCRSVGHIVITVASSRIASLLLVGGCTAHSTFSIPLDVLENSICGFSKQSLQAELFRETKLIICDEVPMQHRHCVEPVDRTLRDTCDSEKPFGGITVVLGGDFQQILPIITKGVREQIVNASLRHFFLWKDIHVLSLNLNMRLNHANLRNANFANFLMEIGTNPQEIIKLPSTIHKCQDLKDIISVVYPQLDMAMTSTATFLTERIILSARNDDVSAINTAALNIFSNPPGLPAFKLELKVGCPIMLLRNIAPKDGLCNGTRLMVSRCNTRIIEAQILTREKFDNLVFIPRISLTPSSSEMPFRMTRRQFPVRLAYALTINKSQKQSVKFVGVDLRIPVFSHGQLYVALSRCTSFDHICVLLPNDESDSTTNIVYPEILL
ncbi:ATP-dependent DNA helicase PIF7-like [Camellia sinensis]|uniref:ATP-dependent DNA helicase PIF7-like n=1 Tax=Camellia sinensis TaxID=4442 RepID=UPI001036814A|nr:ATP-dependent DNA helicase PIF7-like [Camellia sinensis]